MKGLLLRSVGAIRRKWAYLRARSEFTCLGHQWVVREGVVNPSLISASRQFAQKALQAMPPQAKSALELGTGCGMTAVLLALRGLKVTAVDISLPALENAAENAQRNGVRLDLILSDWDAKIPTTQQFDYVVANPPYLRHSSDPAFTAGTQLEQVLACLNAVRNRLAAEGRALLMSSSWSGRDLVLQHIATAGLRVVNTDRKFCGNEWIYLDLCEAE
ncbi:MAG: class I SAM-dependent methyltransferase [Acidobacteria bacterium]|nr:class I SAM-dependent methyltransferase [Acidobacteriota bacterium]MCB9397696.1 class I SAM-dependent methyltransferase [Acidobacteriota bacterium]